MLRLDNKVAFVTGCGSVGPGWGNGRAAAVLFAGEGARVFAVDRAPDTMKETLERIREVRGEATAHYCDVTDNAAVAAMVRACLDQYGRVDVLVCNRLPYFDQRIAVRVHETGRRADSDEVGVRVEGGRLGLEALRTRHVVRVHAGEQLTPRQGDHLVECAHVARVRPRHVPYARVLSSVPLDDVQRVVGRPVVDDEELEVLEGLFPHAGDRAVVRRGLSEGVKVVTAGAAELFGTEFGAGH